MKTKQKHKIHFFAVTMAILFFLTLAGTFVARNMQKEQSFSEEENRVLQTRPALRVDKILDKEFEDSYENYVNDQFPLRNYFVQLKTTLNLALGQRESNGIVLGDDAYLMQKFTRYEEETAQKKADALCTFMQNTSTINHYFLMAPTAINILEDKLPDGIPLEDQNAAMDEFFSQFTAWGGIPVDVRESFRNASGTELYYHTDHHWTTHGAYLAFTQLLHTMQITPIDVGYEPLCVYNKFQGSLTYASGFCNDIRDNIYVYFPRQNNVESIVSYVEEQTKNASLYNHEKLATKESYEVFLDGNHSLVKIQSQPANKRVLLILKDSYANCFIPFLTPYFSDILVVDPRYYYDDLPELLEVESVTDILYLYNANTFFEDTALTAVLR